MKFTYIFVFVCFLGLCSTSSFAQSGFAPSDCKAVKVEDCPSTPTDKVLVFQEGSKIYRLPKPSASNQFATITFINRSSKEVIITTSTNPASHFTTKTETIKSMGFGTAISSSGPKVVTTKLYKSLMDIAPQTAVTLMSDGANWFVLEEQIGSKPLDNN